MNLHVGRKEIPDIGTRMLLPGIMFSSNDLSIDRLNLMGYVGLYLEDGVNNKKHPQCVLLIFQTSEELIENGKWSLFVEVLKMRDNLIDIIEYGERIFGFWYRIDTDRFGDRLIYWYSKGKYSKFPMNYIKYLGNYEKRIAYKDKKLQKQLEELYNVDEGILDEVELERVPYEWEKVFKIN